VYVEGAEPGDALVVDIISIKHKGWGWNAVIPNFGLLGEEYPEPYLHHYKLGETSCEFRPDIHIPYEPFCGVMGVAPREAGRFSTIPPRENAGNIDIRHLTPGSKAFFPVLVPGVLFSCGDCHSAQGDGEVNGTGIETPMSVTLTLSLQKGQISPNCVSLRRRVKSSRLPTRLATSSLLRTVPISSRIPSRRYAI